MEIADISIIYQDHHLLIVNKPAGLVIHPTYKYADGTMWDLLLSYLAEQGILQPDNWQPPAFPDEPGWMQAPPAVREMLRQKRIDRLWQEEGLLPRPNLLHRLDKDTSGVVALARTQRSRRHLIRQFRDHSIIKRYLAVTQEGAPPWTRPHATFTVTRRQSDGNEIPVDPSSIFSSTGDTEYVLNGPLQRDPADRRRCIVGPDGQEATTMCKVLASENGFALLDVRPITGRTHQIRAHLAALGHAIVGDQTYAPPTENRDDTTVLARQFLHAYSLTLRRYPDNIRCSFVAPLAYDLVAWLACCFPAGLEHITANVSASVSSG